MSTLIKSKSEIDILREGGKILGSVLRATAERVKEGVTTADLDAYAEKEILRAGGRPAFKGYGPKGREFPSALCTSLNEVVVHGIPSKNRVLKKGDVVSLDLGMLYKGLYTDTATTVTVGNPTPEISKLLAVTKEALTEAIKQAKPGNRVGDIGYVVQRVVEQAGFGVVRDLVGHGVGYSIHEDPQIPNYGKAGTGMALKEGMVIAIEPMVTVGDYHLEFDDDGWTVSTSDKSIAAHFEHTVAITKNGAEILT